MSFLSVLGKVGKGLLGLGGGIDYGRLGSVVSGAAQGSADQRLTEGQLALQRYIAESTNANNRNQLGATTARDAAQFGQSGARDQFSAGMQGAQFGAGEQQRGMRNALIAQLMGGLQDAKLEGGSGRIPKMAVAGGLRPSVLDANTGLGGMLGDRAGGGMSPRQALMAQLTQAPMQAPEFVPGAPYQAPTPYDSPEMPGAPTAGTGEKVLGGIGLGGSILGAIGGLFGNQRVPRFGAAPYGAAPPRTA